MVLSNSSLVREVLGNELLARKLMGFLAYIL